MKKHIFPLILLSMMAVACWDDDAPMSATPSADLLRTADVELSGGKSQGAIHVEANCPWTAFTEASWLSLEQGNGTGTTEITITAKANPSATTTRNALVTIKTASGIVRNLTVRQMQGAVLKVSPATFSLPAIGAQYSVTVDYDAEWNITNNTDWLTGFSATNGTGGQAVTFTSQDNYKLEARTATFAVETEGGMQQVTVSVEQAAGELPLVGELRFIDCDGYQAQMVCESLSSMFPITEYGICYGEDPTPSISDLKVICGTSLPQDGTFSEIIGGLTKGSTYYARAYATSAVGTAYGPEISFISLPMPGNGDNPRPLFTNRR